MVHCICFTFIDFFWELVGQKLFRNGAWHKHWLLSTCKLYTHFLGGSFLWLAWLRIEAKVYKECPMYIECKKYLRNGCWIKFYFFKKIHSIAKHWTGPCIITVYNFYLLKVIIRWPLHTYTKLNTIEFFKNKIKIYSFYSIKILSSYQPWKGPNLQWIPKSLLELST
jgi:hypothetical protein